MTDFPLRYVRQNVLFGRGGERAALYRLSMISYPYLPVAEKWRALRALERMVGAAGADFSLWRVNRAYPASRYADELEGLLDERGQDPAAWREYLEGHRARLERLASHVPEVYLAVSLGQPPARGFGAGVLRSVDRARQRLAELAPRFVRRPIAGAELSGLALAEQRMFEGLRATVGVQRASTREVQWLLRRAGCRGVGEPVLDRWWAPDALVIRSQDDAVHYQPLERDLWRCCNAPMTEPGDGHAVLKVEAEEGTGWQAFLCLGALADEAQFPGALAELLFAPLEALAFPVDAVFHGRWVPNREALSQVRKRIIDVEHAYRERAAGSLEGPGLLAEEDRALAREYEAILGGSAHPPMLYGWFSLAVGAPKLAELDRRVGALRDRYGDITLHRPKGLQHQLFLDHLPRADGGATRDYVTQLTVEQFAASMPLATQQLGAQRGIYLGWSPAGGGRPVLYDPTAPSRESRPSTVLLVGDQGSGKTMCAQLIAYGAERRGSRIIDVDPRPDHGFHRVPALEGRVEAIELSADPAHRGKLDPLQVAPADMREEIASSYYLDLLRDPPPSWENAIQRAVRDVVRRRGRGSLEVIDQLRHTGDRPAREAADALEVLADFGLARLGFGSGEEAEGWTSAPVTTIRTPGLSLPRHDVARETYTRAERTSVVTLGLVAALALRLVAEDRSRHKIVLLDEAWFMYASAQGRAVLNRLVRLGRALNVTVLLVVHLIGDLEELADLVGSVYAFGQESEQAAAQALRVVRLDPDDPARIAQLLAMREGRCLMRDLHGRVGEAQIDPADPVLLNAFDTTPEQERETTAEAVVI